MKKKIAILGSTGSIGQNTFDILKKKILECQMFLFSAKLPGEGIQKTTFGYA